MFCIHSGQHLCLSVIDNLEKIVGSRMRRFSQCSSISFALIICILTLLPALGYALRDSPAPWLRQLCESANMRLEAIAVNPSSVTLDTGEQHNFEAQATFSDGTNQDVTELVDWTSSDPNVGTIDNQGAIHGDQRGKYDRTGGPNER